MQRRPTRVRGRWQIADPLHRLLYSRRRFWLTLRVPFSTCETVVTDTFAVRATSSIVAGLIC